MPGGGHSRGGKSMRGRFPAAARSPPAQRGHVGRRPAAGSATGRSRRSPDPGGKHYPLSKLPPTDRRRPTRVRRAALGRPCSPSSSRCSPRGSVSTFPAGKYPRLRPVPRGCAPGRATSARRGARRRSAVAYADMLGGSIGRTLAGARQIREGGPSVVQGRARSTGNFSRPAVHWSPTMPEKIALRCRQISGRYEDYRERRAVRAD